MHTDQEVLQRALRAKICPDCYQRPMGSENLGPDVPRRCESGCSVFVYLSTIEQILRKTSSPSLRTYEIGIRDAICQVCHLSDSHGDYCTQWITRTCPLSRQAGEIINVLESVIRARGRLVPAET